MSARESPPTPASRPRTVMPCTAVSSVLRMFEFERTGHPDLIGRQDPQSTWRPSLPLGIPTLLTASPSKIGAPGQPTDREARPGTCSHPRTPGVKPRSDCPGRSDCHHRRAAVVGVGAPCSGGRSVATKLPGPADSKKLACRSGMSPARCGRQRCAGCAWRAICANHPVYARRSKWCWAPRSILELGTR
jgi:hypothetical protein